MAPQVENLSKVVSLILIQPPKVFGSIKALNSQMKFLKIQFQQDYMKNINNTLIMTDGGLLDNAVFEEMSNVIKL